MNHRKRTRNIILGLLLFFAAFLIPGLSLSVRASIGTVLWMGYWWVSMPVDPGVTALIPILVNALLSIAPMEKIISSYFSEIIVLLLGADLITITWEKTGVDKRLSVRALSIIGPSLRQQILVWFLLSAVLSAVLPNAVVCAVLTPIAVSMLRFSGESEISSSAAAMPILATIAWGSGIGGIATPLGGAMNLVAVNYIEELTNQEFLYVQWLRCMVPFFLVLSAAYIVYLILLCPKGSTIKGSKAFFRQQAAQLPPMSRDEILSLVLFLCPTVLAFLRPLYAGFLPGLKPAYVFLFFGVAGFLLAAGDKSPFLSWKEASHGIIWGLLLLFGGGLALGSLITGSGATEVIAQLVQSVRLDGGFLTILILVAFTVLLAEISSNTAAAAISVPVATGVVQAIGLNPIPYLFIIAAAFNCANILPTSIRSISVGHGLPVRYMVKNGLVLTIIGILLISAFGYLFLLAWNSGFFFA